MTENDRGVNRKITILCEECSAKMKKVHDAAKHPLPVQGEDKRKELQ
jgi:hypothetical protein